jgi:uncharacterized protein (TIGR03437 family)
MMGVNWRIDLYSGDDIPPPPSRLEVKFTDPRGDQTGRIDVIDMTLTFDRARRTYDVVLIADPGRPFVGEFRVNVNLFNPDAPTEAGFLSGVSRSFNLPKPATALRFAGEHNSLMGWRTGHRVATSPGPFGSPPGSTLFRSSVFDQPQPSCAFDPVVNGCKEDIIAWGGSTTIAEATSLALITALSSASYLPAAAPDSLVTLFGSGLAPSDAGSTTDPEQAGVRVEINDRPVALSYVSPTQINGKVPRETELGEARISVKHRGVEVASGVMNVSLTAPALFSSDGSGQGTAVAFNAVTYSGAPFAVVTPENPGADKRTRLSLLGTGFRYAGNSSRDPVITNAAPNVRVRATAAGGRTWTVPVEYAGPAPGFPGVDQANIVLPGDADSVDVLNLALDAAGVSSNTLSIPIRRSPAAPPSLNLSPEDVFSATGVSAQFAMGQDRTFYTLTNTGSVSLSYTVRSNVVWISVSPSAGTLAPNANVRVAVSVASPANDLAPGTYTGTITFVSGPVAITRDATLVVTPIGECLNIGGRWNVEESGTLTTAVTIFGETETDRLPVRGQGLVEIIQEGCSIRYTPPPVTGLFTQQQAQSLQRTGTVSANGVSVEGLLALASSLSVPGLTIQRVDENRLQASGRVVAGGLTMNSTGIFQASGTFSAEGQSGTFDVAISLTSTASFRRSTVVSNSVAPTADLDDYLRLVVERILRRSR